MHHIVEGLERMRPEQKMTNSLSKRPIAHAVHALSAINTVAKIGCLLHFLMASLTGFDPAKFLHSQEKSRSEERHFKLTREGI